MLRLLITEMYGGKIDSEHDFSVLSSIVDGVMTPAAFEEEFSLVGGLQLPGSAQWSSFVKWVNDLPEREPPTYLGLPANAEKLLLVGQAKEVIGKLGVVMDLLDEGERVMAEADAVAAA
jgi:dynein heavy chain 1, cytosolic